MKYGLKQEVIDKISRVLHNFPAVEKVVLYGSRAMGNHRNNSDIDLTLFGKQLDLTTLFRIETELDDLLLPFKIDLSIFHKIDNSDLLAHIKRKGKIFFEKEKKKIPNPF